VDLEEAVPVEDGVEDRVHVVGSDSSAGDDRVQESFIRFGIVGASWGGSSVLFWGR